MKATSCLLCHGGEPYAYHDICPPRDATTTIEIPVCVVCHEYLIAADWFGVMLQMIRADAARSTWKGRDQTDTFIADKYRLVADVRGRYIGNPTLIDQR